MTTDPLRRLARAAVDLGRDINREPLPESGPREIRHAARAFNMMQTRLRNHIHQRNQMLAAISHDLQTPLTRLRLRLEESRSRDTGGSGVGPTIARNIAHRHGGELWLENSQAIMKLPCA